MENYNNVNDIINELENLSIKINDVNYNLVFELINAMFEPFVEQKFKCLTQVNYVFEEDLIANENHCRNVIKIYQDRLIEKMIIDEDINLNIKLQPLINKILKKVGYYLKSSTFGEKKYYTIKKLN